MKKKRFLGVILAVAMILSLAGCGGDKPSASTTTPPSAAGGRGAQAGGTDYPTRSITLVVPFDAGGATDLIARAMQPKMEEYLGTTIAVQNMSGGSTAIGNQFVLDADPDGYTLVFQATEIANIWTMNQSDITYRDFSYVGIAAAVPGILVVHPDSKLNTLEDLAAALKSEQLTVGVCGGGCAWTLTMGRFVDSVEGTSPEYIAEGSGKNAGIAAMKGEVDVGSCGVPEVIELLQGGELKALGCFTAEDIEIEGYGMIPSIANVCPELKEFLPYGGFVGMAAPNDVPQEIVDKLCEAFAYAWEEENFQSYLESSHFVPLGTVGKDAEAYVAQRESLNASLLWDLGIGQRNPADKGIEHY